MSHHDNMHTWMTAEDMEHCIATLHKKGPEACYHAEVYAIRKRREQARAEAKIEHASLQVQMFVLLAIALLSGCTPIARAQTALAIADTSGAIGCIAEAAGESWGAPLCRAAEWLADFARRRVDKLTTRAEERAAAELEAAVEACDTEPTPEQLAAVELAQASCDLEGPVTP